jgi:BirA family biotin operon repressor/biotin-[acetyl-CoA-carboxylase] ligase
MVTGMPPERAKQALSGTRFEVTWVAETGSTNQDLLAAARDGAPEGAVLVADHQSAGRGRLGRTWEAPPGASLLLSILLRPDLPLDQAHAVTAAVGLSAAYACEAMAGFRPGLKWPNDLVVGRHKLAGILAESQVRGDRLDAVVVGLGLNVNWPHELPAELADIAVAANHVAGHDVDRENLLFALLRDLERRYADLHEPGGVARLRAAERSASATIGQRVRVELAGETFEGTATAITDAGHLVVDGREVTTADVIHLRPAT